MRRSGLNLVGLLACGIGAAGCGGGEAACPEGGTGSVHLEFSGVPAGATATVELTSGEERRTANAPGHLDDFRGGKWVVTPEPLAVAGGLIRTAWDAPAAEVCVRDGEMVTVELNWAPVPSSAKLWSGTVNGKGPVVAMGQADLVSTGAAPSAVVLQSKPQINRAQGMAFDRRGNLWVADPGGQLKRFAAAELGGSGERVPDLIVESSELRGGVPGPVALAFDQEGRLWASVGYSKKVLRFDAAQLHSGEAQTPAVMLSGFTSPKGLAFDSGGHLWVADGSRIVKVEASALGTSGEVTSAFRIEAKTPGPSVNTLDAANDLVFDKSGNLWVSFAASNVIASLTPADRDGSGEKVVTPEVQVVLPVSSLLGGIVWDEEGHLWSPFKAGQLARLSPSQLSAGGDVTPAATVDNTDLGSASSWLAAYPAPAGLPVYHSLP